MQSKTLNDLRKTFNKRLQIIYSNREAESIGKWALMHLLNLNNQADFILNGTDAVQPEIFEKAMQWLVALEKGRPIQHLIGEVEFSGLRLKVNEHVLIPRPETEELVHLILDSLPNNFNGSIIDIGTGSGCIPLALKIHLPNAAVSAAEISTEALKLAKLNAELNNLDVRFEMIDILKFENFKIDRFDVIVSNPPYIPLDEKVKMDTNVLDYEPHLALFAPTDDALLFYRRIFDFSKNHLNIGGKCYFELHENYALKTLKLAKTYFQNAKLVKDLQQKDRFLICSK